MGIGSISLRVEVAAPKVLRLLVILTPQCELSTIMDLPDVFFMTVLGAWSSTNARLRVQLHTTVALQRLNVYGKKSRSLL